MRRKDREILNREYIDQIIQSCDCCRLGFQDKGSIYIVPLNFSYCRENGRPVFYFHSAKDGRKITLIKENSKVGFELDTNHQIKTGKHACEFSFGFQSVIGEGQASIVHDFAEKEAALRGIMQQYSGKSEWDFSSIAIDRVVVLKLLVENMSCKENA